MCKTFASDVYMKRMNSINYNLSYLLVAVRYWGDNYISDPWALATDIWCCQGLATAPQPFLWHNNGRGQPEGWGREAAERCQPPDSNSRQASGPFTGNYRCAQPTGEGRKGGEGGGVGLHLQLTAKIQETVEPCGGYIHVYTVLYSVYVNSGKQTFSILAKSAYWYKVS